MKVYLKFQPFLLSFFYGLQISNHSAAVATHDFCNIVLG
jgi:hypothetical protein